MFTDEDLKWLKERGRVIGLEDMEAKTDALLDRLEAAEQICEAVSDSTEEDSMIYPFVKAWLRSKGEGKGGAE